jgi:Kef-type K+ transport system membrane component KefB/mannitol/fructose-specific phosphotransferase system IIA component (Ntr-type)
MTTLVLEIGVIIFAVRLFGALSKKVGIPSVLGELIAGIVIGPFVLGGIPLPGLPDGLFPATHSGMPVSIELYGFATVASIILLFFSGLETDISLFLRYSVAGSIVGLGGVIFAFAMGDLTAMLFLNAGFMDPRCLFLGILSTATSVGITARILTDQRKMDSPEGVTILAAAVFDDVLGIICLAVVLGIIAVAGSGHGLDFIEIAGIALKAFGIWLGFTTLGLIFARRIAGFLKIFKSTTTFSVCAMGLALILAGIFQEAGLAMIIGAYIVGLSLSKTDIAFVIQDKLHGIYDFFVPLFFAVMGMLVDIRQFASTEVLMIGGVYTLVAIASKVLGCGLPALFTGFNMRGALRIGVGMVPRGEVALIIAGIGITAGIIDSKLFGIVIMMTLVTTLFSPPVLSAALKLPGRGTRNEREAEEGMTLDFAFPDPDLRELVINALVKDLEREGFYVHKLDEAAGLYQFRKDDLGFSLAEGERDVKFEFDAKAEALVRTALYEALLETSANVEKLKSLAKPEEMRRSIAEGAAPSGKGGVVRELPGPHVLMRLKASSKDEAIVELVDRLDALKLLKDRGAVLASVREREATMSTALQEGVMIPHGKSDGVEDMRVVIGLKPEGIACDSIDGKPSTIFVLTVSPKHSSGPHLQFLAGITGILRKAEVRQALLAAKTEDEVIDILSRAGSE